MAPIASGAKGSVATINSSPADCTKQQEKPDHWVPVRRTCSPKQRPTAHDQPIHVSHPCPPVCDTPTKGTVTILFWIEQNVTK